LAYEAVPEGVEIQKLTSAERDALSRYKIHENINVLLGNENTPTVLFNSVVLIITGVIAKQLAEDFKLPEIHVKESIAKTVDASNIFKGLPYAPSEDIVIQGVLKKLGLG